MKEIIQILGNIKEIYATNSKFRKENEKLILKSDLKINHLEKNFEMAKNMINIENYTGMNLEIISENFVNTQHLFVQQGKQEKWELEFNNQNVCLKENTINIKFNDTFLKLNDIINVNINDDSIKYHYDIHDNNNNGINVKEVSDLESDENRPYIVGLASTITFHRTLSLSSPIIIENVLDIPLHVNIIYRYFRLLTRF